MSHIFISYSHKDKEYIEKLEKKLIEEGFDVWVDHRIDYGSQWPKEIQRQLDACAAFIVVVSDNSFESKWVQNEVARADRKNKPFFPLLLQGDAWLTIEASQYVDVNDKSLPPKKFYTLLETVVPRNKSGAGKALSDGESGIEQDDAKRTPPPRKKPRRRKFNISIKLVVSIGAIAGLTLLGTWILPSILFPENTTQTPPATTPPTEEIPTPGNTPVTKVPVNKIRTPDGMTMIYIPAGEFEMGSEDADEEKPIHTVYLDAFWVDQTEITNAMFRKFLDETGYVTDAETSRESWTYDGSSWSLTKNAYWSQPDGPGSNLNGKNDHPVVHISWNDAREYCRWAGGRLLTEAEWEKAARGTEGWGYPWGNTLASPEFLNFDLYFKDTVAVGSYERGRSPYGLYDMAGNVWEWVSDWYQLDYYEEAPSENPTGPSSGEKRVIRGGSWDDDADDVTSATRGQSAPNRTSSSIGFRCGATP